MRLPVRSRIVPKRTKSERKAQRAHLSLEEASISEKTRARYSAGLQLLLPILQLVRAIDDLDFLLTDWVEQMWSDGQPLYKISDALCGFHFYEPWSRKKIPNTWRLFAVWRKLEVPSRAPPLTSTLIDAMAMFCIHHDDLPMACLLLIGFYGLLRTGELLSLRACDLLISTNRAIISLLDTKSGQRQGVSEMVHVDHWMTVETLQALQDLRKSQGHPQGLLWASTASEFRRRFNLCCSKFDLGSFGFRPYSLRRGGATHLFQHSRSMETTLLAGRWQSQRTARIYISDALSFLPSMVLSPTAKRMVQRFSP